MTVLYNNRYGDEIIFEDTDKNTVTMRDYHPDYFRCAYSNDYSDAYEIYCLECLGMEEPDETLLIEDGSILREMTYQEFAHEVDSALHNNKHPFHKKYSKFVKTDKSRISMFDPAGGPYISLGTDLSSFFKDKKKRIVEEISIQENKVVFKVTSK